MKITKSCYLIFLVCLALVSCSKDRTTGDLYKLMSRMPAQKYFSSDVLNKKNAAAIYGTWEVSGTSGGFSGMGYTKDFDYLLLKPNGIFGIFRNDSLISYGEFIVKSQTDRELLVQFVPDTNPAIKQVEITADAEKYVCADTHNLTLNAPCCDRFNTHFKRVQ